MKIKKYFAATMREALNMARQAHGPDVVILNNRRVLGGVELTAAENYDENQIVRGSAAVVAETAVTDGRPLRDTLRDDPRGAGATDARALPELARVKEEIESLRTLLEQQMSGLAWADVNRRHPLRATLLRRLGAMGVAAEIANTVVRQIPEGQTLERAWRTTLALLRYRIPVASAGPVLARGMLVLTGPSGAGKTTTLAKIAARHVLARGTSSLILATADTYRVGAREQLRSYAAILGVPFRAINAIDDLRRLLQQFHGCKLILLDTAGLAPADGRLQEQLYLLQQIAPPVDFSLVLSAAAQPQALQQGISHYAALRPQYCILTKLDEANGLGAVLSTAIQADLQIIYQCAGQSVPDDLQAADATDLIVRANSLMKRSQGRTDTLSIERDFGAYAARSIAEQAHG